MWNIGDVTKRGILDIGRGCPQKCPHCFYFHQPMIGFEKEEDLKQTLRYIKEAGKEYYDITGGEPSLHPKIANVISYGREIDLYGCMITTGIWLKDGVKEVGPKLMDAGIHDFRISLHGLEPLYNETVAPPVDNGWERVIWALDWLRDLDFSHQVNTVVTGINYKTLPDIARFIAQYPVRIHNLLSFRHYYEWTAENSKGTKLDIKDSEAMPYIEEAIEINNENGIATNLRYFPYCVLKPEYRKHQVGIRNYQFDPLEWDNVGESVESALGKSEEMVRQRNVFSHPCFSCKVRTICDGLNAQYAKLHKWDEITPIRDTDGSIVDVNHYRKQYPEVHIPKPKEEAAPIAPVI